MNSRIPRVALVALALVAATRAAAAHPAPFSFVDVQLGQPPVRGAVVVHVFDVAHELGIAAPDTLLAPGTPRVHAPALKRILDERLVIALDGQRAMPVWTGIETLVDRRALRLAFTVPHARPGRVSLSAHLFPYDPQHQTFVNVYEAGTLRQQAILDARHPTTEYMTRSAQGVGAVVATFVPAGLHHILIGPDHVLFLVALVVLGGSFARLLAIVTGFTIGHSITLSLAATGVLTPPAIVVEPAIALSIVIVGLDNLMARRDGPAARDLRPWAALAFGLVHGFGFASVLREFGLPPAALGWSLLSFNVGVELGQVAVVAAVVGVTTVLRRHDPRVADRVAQVASTVIVLAGAWWFAVRVFV